MSDVIIRLLKLQMQIRVGRARNIDLGTLID